VGAIAKQLLRTILGVTLGLALTSACTREVPQRPEPSSSTPARAAPPPPPPAPPAPVEAGLDASPEADASRPPKTIDGPHELPLAEGRPIYYAFPGDAAARPYRLIGHLHGMCGPPSYACGKWLGAGTDVGAMVCPTGNARCGDSPFGPPSWEADTWAQLVLDMDHDLEASIAKVLAKRPGAIDRKGSVLTGYSRGAYAAAEIVKLHPGRWPYLVLIEAKVPLVAERLVKAGVKAVALVAGEVGTEIANMRQTTEALEAAGYPVKLWVMPKAGHLYSDDMERIMSEALAWVLSHP